MAINVADINDIGITGPRQGCTLEQEVALEVRLANLSARRSGASLNFRFGDCIGVDEHGATVAKSFGYRTIAHPPSNPELRAFFLADEVLQPRPYLDRNRDIVDMSDILIACPRSDVDRTVQRGGTWYTVRYARSLGKPILFIFGDGTVRWENA